MPPFTGKNAVSTLLAGYRNERWQPFPQCLWFVLITSCHTECIYHVEFKNWPQNMGARPWRLNRTAWLLHLEQSFICSFICSFIQKKHCPRHRTKMGKSEPAFTQHPVCPLEWHGYLFGGGRGYQIHSAVIDSKNKLRLRSSYPVWQCWAQRSVLRLTEDNHSSEPI